MTLSLCNHLAADSAYQALRRDVLDGLAGSPKSLPPKWFYDSVGSDLFDQITRLPEYYPTRTEHSILERHAKSIAERVGRGRVVIEFGSGSSTKTPLLLSAIEAAQAFPRLFLVVALAAVSPPSAFTAVWILAATGWMPIARLVRAETRGGVTHAQDRGHQGLLTAMTCTGSPSGPSRT